MYDKHSHWMVDKETMIYDQKLYYNWSQNRLNIIETLNNIKGKRSTTINSIVRWVELKWTDCPNEYSEYKGEMRGPPNN